MDNDQTNKTPQGGVAQNPPDNTSVNPNVNAPLPVSYAPLTTPTFTQPPVLQPSMPAPDPILTPIEPILPPLPQEAPIQEKPLSTPIQASIPQPNPVLPPVQPPAPTPSAASMGSSNPPKRRLASSAKWIKVILGLIVVAIIISVIVFLASILTSKKSTGEVTLQYWGLWEDAKVMEPIISDFERLNPNIKVSYSRQDIKQYRESLSTRIDNGNGPDIFVYHNSWYPMLSSILLPLPSDTISKDEFSKTFYPVAQSDLIRNGAIFGIPMGVDTLSMYVNKDIFSAAGVQVPKTWNEFVDASRSLTVKDEDGKIKTAGAALGTYDNVTHAPDILSLLFLQNSVDFSNLSASSDRIQGAFNFYTSFANDVNNVWDNTLDPSILAFSKGSLAMYFGYSWDYFTLKQYNPNLNFEIVPVPQLADQSVNMASYWASGISVKTPHQKEALLFAKFLAQKSTEQSLYLEQSKERAFGEPYARIDLADSLKDNPVVYPFLQQAPTASSTYFVSDTNDNGLNQQLNTYLGNAINSIITGNSVEGAFDTFSQGVTQVLQQYGQ